MPPGAGTSTARWAFGLAPEQERLMHLLLVSRRLYHRTFGYTIGAPSLGAVLAESRRIGKWWAMLIYLLRVRTNLLTNSLV